MFLSVLLSILLGRATPGVIPGLCSQPTGALTGEMEMETSQGGEKSVRTVISSNIALDETLCYKRTYNHTTHIPGQTKNRTVLYTLTYDTLKHVYNFKNTYEFAIPATEMTCWCDCPGGSNQCDSDTDSCGKYNKKEDTCVNWYEDGQTLDGCLWITGSGQSCCNLDIVRFSADSYQAVEIASPATVVQLRLNVIDMDSKPPRSLIKDKVYNVDLDSGSTSDELVAISIVSSSTTSLLPPGWYFGRKHSGELKTNVKINGLNEWDMNKLGWYKIHNGVESIRKSIVRDAFSASTQNCGENNLDTNFAASYYNRYPSKAVIVESYLFSKIDKAIRNDSSRQVIAYHRSSPLLDLKLTFKEKSKIDFIYDKSYVADFKGHILLDKYSNRLLNLTLIGGSGSIDGTVEGSGSEGDQFSVYIPTKNTPSYHKFVRISSVCREDHRAEGMKVAKVCVKPRGGSKERKLCKQVICTEDRNMVFEVPDDEIEYERAEYDDILSLSTWAKYLNPIEWFKGGTPSWVEGVVITVLCFLILIVVGIVMKLLKMFGCLLDCLTCCGLCRCNFKSKKFNIKKKYLRRKKYSLSSEDSTRNIEIKDLSRC